MSDKFMVALEPNQGHAHAMLEELEKAKEQAEKASRDLQRMHTK